MERIEWAPGRAVYGVRRPDWRGMGRTVRGRLAAAVGLAAVGTGLSPAVAEPILRACGLVW